MLFLRSDRRRRLGSKFAVADLAAGIGDVAARGQRARAGQHHNEDEWRGRFRPAQRGDDAGHAQSGERIENVNNPLGACFVFIEPGMTIVICHSQNAVVSLLAKFKDRPCGNRSHEYQNQRHNLRSAVL